MFRNFKVLITVLVILVLAGGAYAFAASNTVPDSSAGYAGKTVAGYTIDVLKYDLNVDNPTSVDAITFTITPDGVNAVAASTVKIQTSTVALHDSWTTCTFTTGATLPARM